MNDTAKLLVRALPPATDVTDLEEVVAALIARIRVLEDAARSVVVATIKVVPQTHLDADPIGCWCCDRWIHLPEDTHEDGCPVGRLAALLDGDA